MMTTMTIEQRISKITRRLELEENLNVRMRVKLETRLAMLQRKQQLKQLKEEEGLVECMARTSLNDNDDNDNDTKPLKKKAKPLKKKKAKANRKFPALANRLARIESKLQTEEDPSVREELEKRRATVEEKLKKEKKKNSKRPGGLKARLAWLEAKLLTEQDLNRREDLENRLTKVQAKLLTQKEEEQQQQQQQQQQAVAVEEEDNMNQELAKLDERSMAEDEDHQDKNTPLKKKGGKPLVMFAGLKNRLARIDAKLKTTKNRNQRTELENRKALLQAKLEVNNQQQQQTTTNNHWIREERLQDTSQITQRQHAIRQRNKQRLIQMEQRARANNNQNALNRIALQQVYVGHFPSVTSSDYVSVFGGGRQDKDQNQLLLIKRANLREQALELARTETGVDWIATDMYQRLPLFWSLEDEIAMFGSNHNKKKKKNNKEEKGGDTPTADSGMQIDAGGIGDQHALS